MTHEALIDKIAGMIWDCALTPEPITSHPTFWIDAKASQVDRDKILVQAYRNLAEEILEVTSEYTPA